MVVHELSQTNLVFNARFEGGPVQGLAGLRDVGGLEQVLWKLCYHGIEYCCQLRSLR